MQLQLPKADFQGKFKEKDIRLCKYLLIDIALKTEKEIYRFNHVTTKTNSTRERLLSNTLDFRFMTRSYFFILGRKQVGRRNHYFNKKKIKKNKIKTLSYFSISPYPSYIEYVENKTHFTGHVLIIILFGVKISNWWELLVASGCM